MTLLCTGCHAQVRRKYWSKAKVVKAMNDPYCLKKGFSHSTLDVSSNDFYLSLGRAITRITVPIRVRGQPLFEIKSREAAGEPFRFSGSFYDNTGKKTLRIIDNEYQCSNLNWDVRTEGGLITINEGKWRVHLVMRMIPPLGVSVDKLNMLYKGHSVITSRKGLLIETPNGSSIQMTPGSGVTGSGVAFDLDI